MSRFGLLFFAVLAWGQDFSGRFAEIRDRATPRELYAFLYSLPKGGDLHQHASLAFYAHRVLDQAIAQEKRGYRYLTRVKVTPCKVEENGPFVLYENMDEARWKALSTCEQQDFKPLKDLNAAERAAWISALIVDAPGEGRNEFFEEIVRRQVVFNANPYLFAELFAENLKLFAAEGVRYVEPQWSPRASAKPDLTPIPPDEGLQILLDRLRQPDVANLKMNYRFQTTVIRFRPDLEQQIRNAYAWVDAHRDWWVGINAAGREDDDRGYALRMLESFREARRQYAGIRLSIHAGEKNSPGHEVRETLLLGAERIGHGVNLITDPDTMLLLRNRRVLVETNLVSNRLLEYTPDLKLHPFPEYLRTGIPVCLNTDDRGSWDSNMTDEYFHAVKEFRLSWEEVVELGRNSLAYSFAPEELKRQMLRDYERDVAAFEQKWLAADWRAELAKAVYEASGYARRNLLATQ
jgi:adenosine deaminase CECR1